MLAVTAAYPSPAEPSRAIYLENLHRELLEVSDGALDICVIAPRIHETDPIDEQRAGVSVSRFDYGARGRRLKQGWSPWTLLRYFSACRRAIRSELSRGKFDVLVAHWLVPTAALAAKPASRADIPMLAYAHGSDVHTYGRGGIGRVMISHVLRSVRRTFAVSEDLQKELSSLDSIARVDVAPMGHGREFNSDVEAVEIPERKALEMIYVGDVSERKGTDDLLEAFRGLIQSGVDARLHMIGARDEGYEAKSSELGDRISWHGAKTAAELATWLRSVDVMVHPSHAEGSPVSIMEALALELPVVATSVGGVPELLESGRFGVLVPPRNPSALTEALQSLEPDALQGFRSEIREANVDRSARCRAGEFWDALRDLTT